MTSRRRPRHRGVRVERRVLAKTTARSVPINVSRYVIIIVTVIVIIIIIVLLCCVTYGENKTCFVRGIFRARRRG